MWSVTFAKLNCDASLLVMDGADLLARSAVVKACIRYSDFVHR
jgi:hypothetical protein